MARQERMLTPDAFQALVDWPQDFSRYLFEEATRLAAIDVADRSVSTDDVQMALPAAFRRLQATIESRLKGPHCDVRKAA